MAIHQSLGPLWPVWSPEWEPADLRLPSSLLVLAAAGALMPGRGTRRLRWVAIAGLGWSLTLGPWLRSLAGDPLPIPLPWLLLHEFVPGFERLWWPIRASVLVVLRWPSGLGPTAWRA